jgi:hypothetical protein
MMRAILVSVDYTDILQMTLPWNRHHFDEVMIVTSKKDCQNVMPLADEYDCQVYATDSFYTDGAIFNKFKALEEALDVYERRGWMCVMDSDVCWPKKVDLVRYIHKGILYTPYRYICDPIPPEIPPEDTWDRYPVHRNIAEFAGYTQVFHAEDPHLGVAPWHQTNWKHAGGADSFFQAKWPEGNKFRPRWKVLHLGPCGVNWCGRASAYTNGQSPPEAQSRVTRVRDFMRRRLGRGVHRFDHEKI